MKIKSKNKTISLNTPKIMGIINLTTDSFSDSNKNKSIDNIKKNIEHMIKNNVSIIDLGAESTRPGAKQISSQQEIDILLTYLEEIRKEFDIWISIDTYKYSVMSEVIKYDIDMINDVSGLDSLEKINLIKDYKIAYCIMHMQNNPQNMQDNPTYNDVVLDIFNFFKQKQVLLNNHNIDHDFICFDPGFGFGKTTQHNYQILKNLHKFKEINQNLLIGLSKKSMIGNVINKDINNRDFGTLTANILAIQNGANIIRVHEVEQTNDMLKILNYYNNI